MTAKQFKRQRQLAAAAAKLILSLDDIAAEHELSREEVAKILADLLAAEIGRLQARADPR